MVARDWGPGEARQGDVKVISLDSYRRGDEPPDWPRALRQCAEIMRVVTEPSPIRLVQAADVTGVGVTDTADLGHLRNRLAYQGAAVLEAAADAWESETGDAS